MSSAALLALMQSDDPPDILSAVLAMRERVRDAVERLRDKLVPFENDDLDIEAALDAHDADLEEAITDARMELGI